MFPNHAKKPTHLFVDHSRREFLETQMFQRLASVSRRFHSACGIHFHNQSRAPSTQIPGPSQPRAKHLAHYCNQKSPYFCLQLMIQAPPTPPTPWADHCPADVLSTRRWIVKATSHPTVLGVSTPSFPSTRMDSDCHLDHRRPHARKKYFVLRWRLVAPLSHHPWPATPRRFRREKFRSLGAPRPL